MERKVKYTFEFKLDCVELVLNRHYSSGHVSKLKGIDESNIRRWVSFYEKFGKAGLLSRKNTSYSADFKIKVLQSIDSDFLSLREACLKFNLPTSSLIIKWQRDFAKLGAEGLKPKPRGRPKIMSNYKRKKHKSNQPLTREEELLQEIERLRCENDLLKKLHALIQAEENKKRKS